MRFAGKWHSYVEEKDGGTDVRNLERRRRDLVSRRRRVEALMTAKLAEIDAEIESIDAWLHGTHGNSGSGDGGFEKEGGKNAESSVTGSERPVDDLLEDDPVTGIVSEEEILEGIPERETEGETKGGT